MARNFEELRKQIRQDPERAARVEEYKLAMLDALALGELRRHRELTQEQVAETLGIAQRNVSRSEGRSEIYLSTLRDYVEAMGGHLEIAAVFDDERVPVAVAGKS